MAWRRREDPGAPARTSLTSGWSLRELREPVIVCRDLTDIELPPGTQVLASGIIDPEVQASADVRQVPPVRTEFALEPGRRRAILFTAGLRPGTLALVTSDEVIIQRLEAEWRTMAARAQEYVERLRIQELAGRAGVRVQTQGLVQDVLPYKDRFMIRLEDEGAIIGVVVAKDPESLRDERILVEGPLERDGSGYPVIQAVDVRRIR